MRFLEKIVNEPKGAKTDLIVTAIGRTSGNFRVAELRQACPGVSVDMIRRVLKKLKAEGRIECLGRGSSAAWRRTGRW